MGREAMGRSPDYPSHRTRRQAGHASMVYGQIYPPTRPPTVQLRPTSSSEFNLRTRSANSTALSHLHLPIDGQRYSNDLREKCTAHLVCCIACTMAPTDRLPASATSISNTQRRLRLVRLQQSSACAFDAVCIRNARPTEGEGDLLRYYAE